MSKIVIATNGCLSTQKHIYIHMRDTRAILFTVRILLGSTLQKPKFLSFSLLLLILLNYMKNSYNYKYTKQIT